MKVADLLRSAQNGDAVTRLALIEFIAAPLPTPAVWPAISLALVEESASPGFVLTILLVFSTIRFL